MWLWIAGWALVSLAAVVVHRRWRASVPAIPPEIAAFMVRFETELAHTQPAVAFLGMVPDRFACVLRVDGQETVVSMHGLFAHAEALPDAFTRAVAGLVGDIREVGLDRVGDLDFAAAAPLLLPQVRAHAWLQQHGAFGSSGLVHTRLTDDLVTVYVVDGEGSMVFVCREHLRRWRKDVADVHNLAMANLARLGNPLPRGPIAEPVVVQTNDGFDAARVLLLEPSDGLLVAIPDRDTLWIAPEQGQDLGRLMAATEQLAGQSAHPVSPRVFRVTDGRLESVPALPGSRPASSSAR